MIGQNDKGTFYDPSGGYRQQKMFIHIKDNEIIPLDKIIGHMLI